MYDIFGPCDQGDEVPTEPQMIEAVANPAQAMLGVMTDLMDHMTSLFNQQVIKLDAVTRKIKTTLQRRCNKTTNKIQPVIDHIHDHLIGKIGENFGRVTQIANLVQANEPQETETPSATPAAAAGASPFAAPAAPAENPAESDRAAGAARSDMPRSGMPDSAAFTEPDASDRAVPSGPGDDHGGPGVPVDTNQQLGGSSVALAPAVHADAKAEVTGANDPRVAPVELYCAKALFESWL